MLTTNYRFNLNQIQKHVLSWIAFIIYDVFVAYSFSGKFLSFFDYAGHYLLNIGIFYLTLFFTFKITLEGPDKLYLSLILLIAAEFFLYVIFKKLLIITLLRFGLYNQSALTTGHFLTQSLWRFMYFVGIAAGFWFAQSSTRQSELIADLKKEQLVTRMEKEELEKTLLLSENSYLKAQINLHFLCNALGVVHNQVYKLSSSAGETVILLADIMQYALRNSQIEELVPVESEIEYIKSYIKINQHRFLHKLNLTFLCEGAYETAMIVPLLFITIVENVFKYGKLIDVEEPATIRISATDEKVMLHVKNQKNNRPSTAGSGIGMSNVIKRLDLHYKNRHELWIQSTEDQYQLNLTIYL